MKLLNKFWSTQEALGEGFREIWVIVNTNSPMPFMSDITNKKMNRMIVTMTWLRSKYVMLSTFRNHF